MKKVLVTGSCGFTGHYVCQLFREQGYTVVGLAYDNLKEGDVTCDLTDEDAVHEIVKKVRPDGVIHLAALSFVEHEDQTAFYKVNIFSVLNLLSALEAENLKLDKFIVASSANVYGNPDVEVIDEKIEPNPINHYAASKLAMEFMVKIWFPRFPIIITRPFNYTGPGQDEIFLVPKIISHFRKREKLIELGNLDVSRDISDVRDIAQCYLKLYESDTRSSIINLCSGRTIKLRKIIDMMNQIAGYDIKIVINNDYIRENEIILLWGNNNKLRSLIGFVPSIPLMDTMKSMFDA